MVNINLYVFSSRLRVAAQEFHDSLSVDAPPHVLCDITLSLIRAVRVLDVRYGPVSLSSPPSRATESDADYALAVVCIMYIYNVITDGAVRQTTQITVSVS